MMHRQSRKTTAGLLLIAFWLGLAACEPYLGAPGKPDDDTPVVSWSEAIREALAEDSRLGRIRNQATVHQDLASVIGDYADAMDEIDCAACPVDFRDALRRHGRAWRDSIGFFRQFDDLRGEMHLLFDQIRAQGPAARQGLEEAERPIWETWREVEDVARKYEVEVSGS